MTKLRNLLFALPFVVLACANDDNSGNPAGLSGNGNNTGSGSNTGKTPEPATSQQISQCKDACDKQKLFDCYDAAKHSACLQDCADANTDQADQFIRCVQNTTCDAECSTELTKPPPSSGGSGTGGSSSGGGTLCDKACDKGIECKQVTQQARSKCIEECNDASVPNSVKQCVIDTPCESIEDECAGSFGSEPDPVGGSSGSSGSGGGGGSGPDIPDPSVLQCESTCNSISFGGDCLPPSEIAGCKARCKTATQQQREDFDDCVFASTGDCNDQLACYEQFRGGSTPPSP